MKHFISRRDFLKVAGAVGAAGALAACGGSGSSSTAASTSASSSAASGAAGGNVSISLWTYPIGSWGGTESKLDDIIAAFNAVHPEITVTYETLDYQNGDNLVTSAISRRTSSTLSSWRRQTSVNRASIKNSWAMRAGTEPSCRGPSLAPHCRMTLA